jgi:hypothetical protein
MVDGAARASSVLTLSHWPQSPTPPRLARDVSAESVLAYLRLTESTRSAAGLLPRQPSARTILAAGTRAEAVTNDHFDEDGLMSVYALVDPTAALADAELLVAVGMCGDFGVVASDEAARVAFAVVPLAEAEAGIRAGTSELYEAVLPVLPELLARPGRFERYWAPEARELAAGRAAIEAGDVEITEHHDLDLAVVSQRPGPASRSGSTTSPGPGRDSPGEPGRGGGTAPGLRVHAGAVHSATTASRILAFDGQRCELYLRYEGWVKTVSRRVPLRPDLAPLAAELSAEEPGGVVWEANGLGAVIGRLHPAGDSRSELDPERIVTLVRNYLGSAEPAWDPWRRGGGHIPAEERAGYGTGDVMGRRRRRRA